MKTKKLYLTCFMGLSVIFGASAFMFKSSTGIQGYAGSPGEATCSSCHAGGSSPAASITITSSPSFSVNENLENEYMPDSLYQIDIEVSASNFTRFGFASQILNSSSINTGTLQSPGSGVKFLNVGQKRTAVHTSAKIGSSNSVVFSYQWKAPHSGDATIYAIANAVNGNGNTGGDFVVSPVNLALIAAPQPEPPDTTTTVGINKQQARDVNAIMVYPNPVKDFCHVSYTLKENKSMRLDLMDLKGTFIKELYSQENSAGLQNVLLDLSTVSAGAYFIRISTNSQKVSQKLIVVRD